MTYGRSDAADGREYRRGTLTKWLKKPGDTVERDEPLFEISTDKVDTEIPSPAAGTLTEVLVQEGADGGHQHRCRAHWRWRRRGCRAAGFRAAVGTGCGARSGGCGFSHTRACRPPRRALQSSPSRSSKRKPEEPTGPAFAAGAEDGAREFYRSEQGDRHRRRRTYHQAGRGRVHESESGSGAGESGSKSARRRCTCAASRSACRTAPNRRSPNAFRRRRPPVKPKTRLEPLSTMRQKIAEHMLMSQATSAHVTTVHKVDMTKVARMRAKHKADFASRYGMSLTYPAVRHARHGGSSARISAAERVHRRHQHHLSQ